MRSTSTASVITGALAFVLASSVTLQPAEAGPACNRIGLNSPCIKSNDLPARINMREPGRDGRLQIRDANNAAAVNLNGTSGNVTNLFSNDEIQSNGLVKAWAQIFADGTVFACWRCNKDPNETRRLATGTYEVDFTPLATDITGRPRSATPDSNTENQVMGGTIILADRSGDSSSVLVGTRLNGSASDLPFVLIIY